MTRELGRLSEEVSGGLQAVFVAAGVPVSFGRVDVGRPGAREIVVRVTGAGVCGSDGHRLAGDSVVDGPVAFGHECVGEVLSVGAGVRTDWSGAPLRPGDVAYWKPTARCGRCRSCLTRPDGSACDAYAWPPPAGRPSAAGFQELALLSPDHPVFVLPPALPPMSVLALGCALPTAVSAFGRLGRIPPGAVVVIQGCGPVGLASTMLAALSPAGRVIVIGRAGAGLVAARRLGATDTIDLEATTAAERSELVRSVTGGRGADVVIEAAGHLVAFGEGIELLGHGGRYVVVGLFAGQGTVPVDPFRINNLNLRIIGSLGNQPAAFRSAVALAGRHHERLGLADLVTHRFPLAQVEEAIRCADRPDVVKAVVVP